MTASIKNYFILILFLLSSPIIRAQDFVKIKSLSEFNDKIERESAALSFIESDFKQVKYMDLLAEKIESKGKFYFAKPDKISLHYSLPVEYLIVINGDKIKIESDGKKNTYSLGTNKMMGQMQTLLSASLTGSLLNLPKEYRTEYFENDKYYKVNIHPSGVAKDYMSAIEIVLDKKDLSVDRLKMIETSNDYTEYYFYNKKKNTEIKPEKFSVK